MDEVDLVLYGGFAVGWLLGRWMPSRSPWVGRATVGSVVVLVALLGTSFRTIAADQLAEVLPRAIGFAVAVLGATAAAYLLLRPREDPGPTGGTDEASTSPDRFPTSAMLVVALGVGYGVGRAVEVPTGVLIPAALTVLLGLVGYGIELSFRSIRRAWVPIGAAVIGSVGIAAVVSLVGGLPPNAAFATALGFGWYSLTGPLVAARLGAGLGLFAFLANFVREGLTILLSPYLGRRLRGEGLAALGGATSMDTTLYFVVRYGDRRAGALSVASGLTLTIAASLVVPFVLAL